MAVLEMRCVCGHRYQAIRSFSTADPDAERCPQCGSDELTALPTHFLARDIQRSTAAMDPLEREMHLENKAYLEANSEKILSGELGIASLKHCPKEFRPVLPERMRTRYY